MARKPKNPQADRAAKAIMDEFAPKTADEGPGGPQGRFQAHDRDNAQGRARCPSGLSRQRQGAEGWRQQEKRLHHQEGAHVGRRGGDIGAPRPRRHLRAGRGAQGRARPVRHRVARAFDVRARHVAARHSRHRARHLRLLHQRRDRLGHHRQDMGGARALARPPPRAGLRLHVRGLHLRAGQARPGRPQRGGVLHSSLRPGGRKDVLGLWMQESEGAHHWMGVFDELRGRGVEDVLFVSMDGVSGLADGLRAIFPGAVAQRCIVHLVRNSCKYVPSRDMQAFCRDARAFYGAPSLAACRAAFADFSERWARYPGAVATWERSIAAVEQLFSFGPDVRRVMYTTNCVESVNASFRKVVRRGCFPTRTR